MMVLAGAFVTFLGFLFAGLLALAFTVLLDRQLGKERALLLFAGLVFVFALFQCSSDPITVSARAKGEKTVPAERIDVRGVPSERPPLDRDPDGRNPFQRHSDTRSLAPVALDLPPWLPLTFELPPTIPGPAPGARRVLRGEMPSLQMGDGSTIPEIPDPVFADYEPVPDDVYDSIVSAGRKTYVYILSIRHDGRTVEEGEPGFPELVHLLAERGPGADGMQVEYALIGGEETAARKLEHTDVLKARRQSISTAPANQFDRWSLRRSVDNIYREVLRAHRLGSDLSTSTDLGAIRSAAAAMEDVGKLGKESREGWRKAALLREIALDYTRGHATAAVRAEILEDLVRTYAALRDEKSVLRVLSEHARTSPGRPEPWLWLGRLHLVSLGIPEEALAYFEVALLRSPRNVEALLGKGDALSALGLHEEALEVYRLAGSGAARVRVAEALLRLGRLDAADAALQSVMSTEGETPRALLVHGAILYARGDLEKAREVFLQAATATGDGALEFRAQACYDLGLTACRLGQADAALAAFDACEKALQYGSSMRRSDDETVSPSFGRALVALAAGNEGGWRLAFQEAREDAPRVAYHEMLAGMVAARAADHAAAVRAFERALRLVRAYPELDGWLAKTRLELGRGALRAGTPIKEAARDFQAAAAFACRASDNEKTADPTAYEALIREAWIRLGAEDLAARHRFDSAREVVRKILQRISLEQPEARAMQGYCNYRLAEFGRENVGPKETDAYAACIRDFQQVLNKVAADDEGPWKTWRDYSARALGAVKHWRSLEEKTVSIEESTLSNEFDIDQSGGVKMLIEKGVIHLDGAVVKDGTLDEPTYMLRSNDLFKVGTFEEVRLLLKIPSRSATGATINPITFGVQVQRASTRSGRRARHSGIGVFYDRGKVALRIGGGQIERWKDGAIHRMVPEMDWPDDGWVEVRIVRTSVKDGRMQIWLDPNPTDGQEGIPLLRDDDGNEGEIVSGFKGTARSTAELWIGGFSNQAQEWFVEIKDIRVIRRK